MSLNKIQDSKDIGRTSPLDHHELRTSKENWHSPNKLQINQVLPEVEVPQDEIQLFNNVQPVVPIVVPPKPIVQEQKVEIKPFFAEADKLSRLELYELHDDRDPLNKQCIPYEGFKGPKSNRVSTDSSWLILFVLIYFVFGVYAYFVIINGKPTRLATGMDFRGELCGFGGLKSRPYLYWGNPLIDMNVAWCVRQCPPSTGRQICMYDVDHTTPTTFCYDQMQADLMGRYCVPKEPANRALIISEMSSFNNTVRKISADLYLCWDIVLIFTGFCIFLSYIFTVLATCKCLVGTVIWMGVWGSTASFGAFSYMCWLEAIRTQSFQCIDGMDQTTCGGKKLIFFQFMTFAIAGLGAIYLIVILVLYRRINRGIELIKRAQHMIQVLSQIRMFPFVLSFIGLAVCGLFFWICINAMTIGDIELTRAKNINGDRLWKIFYTFYMQNLIGFAIFTLIFTMTLLQVMNDMFTSYALSVWFFTKQKDTVLIPMSFVVKTLYRYHFGTCIFITFNLIFLSVPKMIVGYIRLTLRSLPQSSNCVRYSQACCMGCVHVFETFLRYISKHTVVQVAIWSEPYYTCAKKAYFLLFRNAEKVKDLDFLQSLVVLQLQLCTSMVAAIPVYLYVVYFPSTPYGNNTNEIQMPIVPTVFVFIVGFFFTALFQGQYDITCKTIIQLYLMDNEMFFGEQRFVEEFIREFMEFVGKAEENEYKIGFAKQIKLKKFQPQEYDEVCRYYISKDGASLPDQKLKSHDSEEDESEYEDEDEKYSDQYVNYDEQQERKNAFIGLPIDEEIKPNDRQTKKDHEELETFTVTKKKFYAGGVVVDSGTGKDQTSTNPSMNQTQTPFTANTQIKLNTSHQSFGLQQNGDISMISDVSILKENPKPKKIIKF